MSSSSLTIEDSSTSKVESHRFFGVPASEYLELGIGIDSWVVTLTFSKSSSGLSSYS